jgi:hypothetical protein
MPQARIVASDNDLEGPIRITDARRRSFGTSSCEGHQCGLHYDSSYQTLSVSISTQNWLLESRRLTCASCRRTAWQNPFVPHCTSCSSVSSVAHWASRRSKRSVSSIPDTHERALLCPDRSPCAAAAASLACQDPFEATQPFPSCRRLGARSHRFPHLHQFRGRAAPLSRP